MFSRIDKKNLSPLRTIKLSSYRSKWILFNCSFKEILARGHGVNLFTFVLTRLEDFFCLSPCNILITISDCIIKINWVILEQLAFWNLINCWLVDCRLQLMVHDEFSRKWSTSIEEKVWANHFFFNVPLINSFFKARASHRKFYDAGATLEGE